jgi:hypothetical protein
LFHVEITKQPPRFLIIHNFTNPNQLSQWSKLAQKLSFFLFLGQLAQKLSMFYQLRCSKLPTLLHIQVATEAELWWPNKELVDLQLGMNPFQPHQQL